MIVLCKSLLFSDVHFFEPPYTGLSWKRNIGIFLHEIKKILTYASENTFLEVIVFKRGQSLNNSIPKKMLLQLRKKIVIAMHKWYWMPTLKVYLPSYHDTYWRYTYHHIMIHITYHDMIFCFIVRFKRYFQMINFPPQTRYW